MSNSYLLLDIATQYERTIGAHQLGEQAGSGVVLTATPVYQQVLTWLLMLPLLNMVAKGALSFLNPAATAFSYQNAYLAKTAQGSRLPVVISLMVLAGFSLSGNQKVYRVLPAHKNILLSLL